MTMKITLVLAVAILLVAAVGAGRYRDEEW